MDRKRVLHLIDTGGPGGAETIFLQIVTGLDSERWHSIAVVPTEDWLAGELRRAGVEPILLPTRGSFDARYLKRLVGLLRERGVHLVHSHLLTSSVYASVVARLAGIPHVATFHGSADLGPPNLRRSIKLRLLFKGKTHVVFVSQSLRQAIIAAASYRPTSSSVISNGIHCSRFQGPRQTELRAELGIPPEVPTLVAVGNIRAPKDYPTLLRAAAEISRRGLPFHLVIAGEHHDRISPELLGMVEALDLGARVSFLGFRTDIPRILRNCDVFVLSSSAEGFSLSTIQAMAAGLPVVATRSGGPEEIVRDGVTGTLVDTADPQRLADALIRVMLDPEAAARMAAAGRKDVESRYSVKAMVAAYDELYTRLVSRPRSDRARVEGPAGAELWN